MMSSRMAKRRLCRFPLFLTRYLFGTSIRRKLVLRNTHPRSGRATFVLFVFVTVMFMVSLMMLLHALPRSSLSLGMAKSSRVRRWTPRIPRQGSYASSSPPFLPTPDSTKLNRFEIFQQHVVLQEANPDFITAIVPVTAESLRELSASLGSILSVPSSILKEIIVVCHPRIISRTEHVVKSVRSTTKTSACVVTVLETSSWESPSLSVLHALSSVLTSRVLLLDSTALRGVDNPTRVFLIGSAFSAVPVGPCGIVISSTNASCVCGLEKTTPVAYLTPPFLSPTSLLIQAENGMRLDVDTWAALGERIVSMSGNGFGGVVKSTTLHSGSDRQCTDAMSRVNQLPSNFLKAFYRTLKQYSAEEWLAPSRVDVLLPNKEDLKAFGPTVCEMAQRGSVLRVMLFSWSYSDASTHFALDVGCHLHFETIPRIASLHVLTNSLKGWVQVDRETSVLMYASQIMMHTLAIETSVEALRLAGITILRLPMEDLPFCEWMSVLGMLEWKNWEKPQITLSVITHNRPRSLKRLLASLSAARYYGDSVQMKINLEQTADDETRKIVTRFRWHAGALNVQHRVVAAGLLPAVVEAWYPHTNDSYGVLLEDDVELSPMFYAWIKMAILRYRYGPLHDRATTLYGVSLYQPTNLELRVEGRVPFEPRIMFAERELPDSHTPYLSQVPCSWGAVYFPEHFSEFHDYLALRLSEVSHDISEEIIPSIRSNRWTRSWKKYFNELVFLRGYVMLYPNYDLSLATNHVEVGAHVKGDANHIRNSIKRQFEVPLMPLPLVSAASGSTVASLLDLPTGLLPSWDMLPVLDLWGNITSHRGIISRGQARHGLISGCPLLKEFAPPSYDATELLCSRSIG